MAFAVRQGNRAMTARPQTALRPGGIVASPVLRLLTLNLGLQAMPLPFGGRLSIAPHVGRRLQAAPAALRGCGADVILLQEVFVARDRDFLVAQLADTHPYAHWAPPSPSLFGNGLLILSRLPLSGQSYHRFDHHPFVPRAVWERGFIGVDMSLPGFGSFRLLNLHLSPDAPYSAPDAARSRPYRAREIADLIAEAATSDRPAILAGDFNAGPEICPQDYDRILRAGYSDAFARLHGTASVPTFDKANPLVQRGPYGNWPSLRADHVFLPGQQPFDALAAEIVLREPIVGLANGETCTLSDHYGLLATLAAR
jgi:endonuclease/exonuclease/phosphatase family metal-dependent hydrolase